jgi:uncharacterized protein (TIGR02246 family)
MRIAVLIVWMAVVSAGAVFAQAPATAKAAVERVVAEYNAALNGAQVDRMLSVFERDGVQMAPNAPLAKGEAELRKLFEAGTGRNVANLKFTPVEVIVSEPYAFVDVIVSGTLTSKKTGVATEQDNKALMVMHKGADGTWRISRYALNSSKPAAP